MNKKGFTLVELLAVIAILAILILLVIPNVVNLFKKAKREGFETELKEIYKTAEQKWMMESLNKKEERVYARAKGLSCANQLSLTGRTDLEYFIKLDKKGNIVRYYAYDNNYKYVYNGPGLKIYEIDGVEDLSKQDNNITITCSAVTDGLCTYFDDDSSWSDVISAIKNDQTQCMNVGDTKEVNMGSFGTHKLRIANNSTPSECGSSGFSQTACGFVLEFADIIVEHNMSDTGQNTGGWPGTGMRTFINNEIYNSLPSEIKNNIINTTVVSGYGTNDSANFVSNDKLYLLTPKEVFNANDNYDHASNLTRQLDYYQLIDVNPESVSGAIKRYGTNPFSWSLRTAYYYRSYLYYRVYEEGGYWGDTGYASEEYGVSPAFRIK